MAPPPRGAAGASWDFHPGRHQLSEAAAQSSVGVAHQVLRGARQNRELPVAVTAALWTGVRAWWLGAACFICGRVAHRSWRASARGFLAPSVFAGNRGRWRCACCGKRVPRLASTAALADAEFGDVTAFRSALRRLRLAYTVGISSHLTVFASRPRLVRPEPTPRGHRRYRAMVRPMGRSPCARNSQRPHWGSHVASRARSRHATHVSPPCESRRHHEWRRGRLAPEIWLLLRRGNSDAPTD